MKMKVLGDKKVEIINPENMIKKFGSVTYYAWKNGVLYINQKALETEQRKLGEHLSTEEVVEDIYTGIRRTGRWSPTLWDILSKRHIDPKYRKRPLTV